MLRTLRLMVAGEGGEAELEVLLNTQLQAWPPVHWADTEKTDWRLGSSRSQVASQLRGGEDRESWGRLRPSVLSARRLLLLPVAQHWSAAPPH